MLLRVDAITPKIRTRSFVATCVSLLICTSAAASCSKSADVPGPNTSTSQNPTVAQPAGGANPPRSSASTSVPTGRAGQGASTSTSAASSGRTSTAGQGAAGVGAASGASANNAGNSGASANAGTSDPAKPPTDPGVPPEVVKAWKEWPLPGKDYNNSRYTQDSTINSKTVSTLKQAWTVSLGGFAVA